VCVWVIHLSGIHLGRFDCTFSKLVCVQLPTSADNVALPAFGHHTLLMQLLLSTGSTAIE